MTTARNQTEPPVNQWMGFEVAPYVYKISWLNTNASIFLFSLCIFFSLLLFSYFLLQCCRFCWCREFWECRSWQMWSISATPIYDQYALNNGFGTTRFVLWCMVTWVMAYRLYLKFWYPNISSMCEKYSFLNTTMSDFRIVAICSKVFELQENWSFQNDSMFYLKMAVILTTKTK